MSLDILINHIIAWHQSKGHIVDGNEYKQFAKLIEEFSEMRTASKKGNYKDLIDAIGDCLVVIIGICEILKLNSYGIFNNASNEKTFNHSYDLNYHLGFLAECMLKNKTQFLTEAVFNLVSSICCISRSENISPEYALSFAYDIIKDRKGININGSFIKNDDL